MTLASTTVRNKASQVDIFFTKTQTETPVVQALQPEQNLPTTSKAVFILEKLSDSHNQVTNGYFKKCSEVEEKEEKIKKLQKKLKKEGRRRRKMAKELAEEKQLNQLLKEELDRERARNQTLQDELDALKG